MYNKKALNDNLSPQLHAFYALGNNSGGIVASNSSQFLLADTSLSGARAGPQVNNMDNPANAFTAVVRIFVLNLNQAHACLFLGIGHYPYFLPLPKRPLSNVHF